MMEAKSGVGDCPEPFETFELASTDALTTDEYCFSGGSGAGSAAGWLRLTGAPGSLTGCQRAEGRAKRELMPVVD